MTEQERMALDALDKLYEENGGAMTKLAEIEMTEEQKFKEMTTGELMDTEKFQEEISKQKVFDADKFVEENSKERSNRILERYNQFYNTECSGLAHGTPITPEFQQAMALECMLDALRYENLNHEFDVVSTADINDLIDGLYQQGKDYLND